MSAGRQEGVVPAHPGIPEQVVDGGPGPDDQALLGAPGQAREAPDLLDVQHTPGAEHAGADVHQEIRAPGKEDGPGVRFGQQSEQFLPGRGRQVAEVVDHGHSQMVRP